MRNKDQILLENLYSKKVLKEELEPMTSEQSKDKLIELFTNGYFGKKNGRGSNTIEDIIKIINDPTEYNKTPEKIMNSNGEEKYAVKMYRDERNGRHLNRMSGADEVGMFPKLLNSLGIVKNPNEMILAYDPTSRHNILDKDGNKIGNGYSRIYKTLGGVAETPQNKDEVLDFLNDILGEVLKFENQENGKREEREKKYKEEDDYISKTNPFIGGKYGSDRGWSTD